MCLYPKIGAFQYHNGKKVFRTASPYFPLASIPLSERVIVPCGKCVECKQLRKEDWTCRGLLEASHYENNIMITLTYNDVYNSGNLEPKHLRDFIKRVRASLYEIDPETGEKEYDKIKFLACGEYGKKHDRPHYHILFFGWKPADMVFFKMDKGVPVFRSEFVEKKWLLGFSSCTEVNENTIGYVVKYLQKYNSAASYIQKGLLPPFFRSSKGVGALDMYRDTIFTDDKIYVNGKAYSTPRYFLRKLSETTFFGDKAKLLLEARQRVQKEKVEEWSETKKKNKKKLELLRLRDRRNFGK